MEHKPSRFQGEKEIATSLQDSFKLKDPQIKSIAYQILMNNLLMRKKWDVGEEKE